MADSLPLLLAFELLDDYEVETNDYEFKWSLWLLIPLYFPDELKSFSLVRSCPQEGSIKQLDTDLGEQRAAIPPLQ